ncbi:MAG: PqqD family protein [Thermodesulfobacteriota bacterium]
MKYSVNRDSATWRILDGEAVIINNETSFYYSLNKTGTYIWNLLLEQELSLEEIVEKVGSRYQQKEGEVLEDIKNILDNLTGEKLVERR